MSNWIEEQITEFINLAIQRLGNLTAEISDNYLEGGIWADEYYEATVISRTLLALQNNYSTLSTQERLALVNDVRKIVNLNRYTPVDLDGSVFVYFNDMAQASAGAGSLVTTFIALTDTFSSFSGRDNHILQVQGSQVGSFDIENKTLATPTILGNKSGTDIYAVFKNDGTTPLALIEGALFGQDLVVDDGAKVEVSAFFQYPFLGSDEKAPQVVSGDFGSTNPGAGVPSATYTHTDLNGGQISSNDSYSVVFSAPKTGLIVVSDNIQFASGSDVTQDVISVTFKNRIYFGPSIETSLTEAQAKALATVRFGDNTETFSSVTAGVGEYIYFLYDDSEADIATITEDGATTITGAFTKIGTLAITNEAGVAKTLKVYRSNATNSFSGNTLKFE